MSDEAERRLDDLEMDVLRRIDAVCRRFEADWRAEIRPAIEDYLADVPQEGRAALQTELAALECELLQSQKAGSTLSVKVADAPEVRPPAPVMGEENTPVDEGATMAPLADTDYPTGDAIRTRMMPVPRQDVTVNLGTSATAAVEMTVPTQIRYFGDYEIVRELARGGMGVVFLARQLSLNRPVALKMILAGQLANETDLKRFQTEAEAAANLDHPGIVPIFEVGEHERQHYFSMGFVEGKSLSQRLAEGPLPPREAAELLRRVSQAVEYAHQHGVIHRDLKPANILLDQNGNPRVTDFGLAKKMQGDSGLTGSGQIMGTPSYMPPEQAGAKRGEVGLAADVYALGATLYALLTGRPPFQAATPVETVLQAIGDEPVPPRRLNASVPIDLETICLKCLQKEPARRYSSASAFGDDLRRYLDGEPIAARPVSRGEKAWKWAKRRPTIASLAATATLATTLGIAGVLWQWRRAEKNYAEAEIQRSQTEIQRQQAQKNYIEAEAQRRIAQDKTREATEKAELLERQNYINLVALAQRENLANNVGFAEQLLDRCPPRLRGWEWQFVNRSNHRELFSVGTRPRPYIRRAALNPDASRIVCCGGNDVWIYDLASGRQLHHLKGHEDPVIPVAWSPDGATIASGGRDRTIRLWDPNTGAMTAVLRGHGSWILDLAFSPDSRWLVAGAGNWAGTPTNGPEVKLWDYRQRREVRAYDGVKGRRTTGVAFSPDGRTIAAGGSVGATRLWDVETGHTLRDFEGVSQMPATNVAFRPDGRMLAIGSDDGTAALWDIGTGTLLRVLRGHAGLVTGVGFSPDGRRLVTGSWDSTVRFWEPETGRETALLRGHHGAVETLQFNRGGTRLLSSGQDGVVKVWDVSLPSDTPVLEGHRGWAFSAVFQPGGTIAATGGWGIIHFWDPATGHHLRAIDGPHPAEVRALAYSPDGKALASAGEEGTIKIWEGESDAPRFWINAQQGRLYALAYSPDGKDLVSAGADGTVRSWDPATGALRRVLQAHGTKVFSLAFSPDGQRLATVGLSGNAKVWDVASGAERLALDVATTVRSYFGNAVAFSPDGRRLAVPRADFRVALFDSNDGRLIRDLAGHSDDVTVIAFSPDGSRLATAGRDRTIRLWDPETGEMMFNLRGHLGGVTWITWSADGRRLMTTSEDRTGRIWDAGPPINEVIRDR
jgi:eukaryotic-like serine/threonine-protein kinase